jgi:hypothetical protein
MPLHEVRPEDERQVGQEYHTQVSTLRNLSSDDMIKYHAYMQEKIYSLEQRIQQYETRLEEQEKRHQEELTFTAINSANLQS